MESLASPRVAFTDLPDALPEDEVILSYSDTTPYEEQKESLADRIGKTKVYLLEEEFGSRKKVRHFTDPCRWPTSRSVA